MSKDKKGMSILKKYQNSYFAYFLMYNFYFLSWALFSTLISVYLLDLGFKASQVSFVVSVSFFSSMLAQPGIGFLNDRFDNRLVITILFSLSLMGSILMICTKNILLITIAYSWVLLIINGANPVLEKIAVSSPFSYGKIRIWGTIGFAIGTQISGLIYDYISPQAIFVAFILAMILSIIGTLGTEKTSPPVKSVASSSLEKVGFQYLIKDKIFLGYLLIIFLFSGANNTGHTYIPPMLKFDGLAVGVVATVVSVSVLFESPITLFSNKFMDHFTSKTIFSFAILAICLQYLVYSLDVDVFYKIIASLLIKHTSGMTFIMVNMKIVNSLVDKKILITALAIVQTVRNLGSILFQNISGFILDSYSFNFLFLFLLIVMLVAFVCLRVLPLPSGNEEKLFI